MIFTAVEVPTDAAIVHMILLHEGIDGEYTDDEADSGGPTKFGVTRPVLAAHRKVPLSRISAADIMDLTREEAEAIYTTQFIAPFAGVADPLRINAIDMGVNAGQGRAIRLLQQTIGAAVDGRIGLETIHLSKTRCWNQLYVGMRLAFYESLIAAVPKNMHWRNGWRRRALSFDPSQAVPRTLLAVPPVFERVGKAYLEAA